MDDAVRQCWADMIADHRRSTTGDADQHYARAKAAGAEILFEIKDEDYGGRGYTCRDPEGHVWNFGTFDPWE